MKIMPVCCVKSNTNRSFNGLWGKTKNDVITDASYYIEEVRHQYYPFIDETKGQIKKAQNAHTAFSQDIPGQGVVADPIEHIYDEAVIVMAALPFTSKDFLKYTMNSLNNIAKKQSIEKFVTEKGLSIMPR